MSQQYAAARTALSMARRARGVIAPLCLVIISPHLQHCVWFGSLYSRKTLIDWGEFRGRPPSWQGVWSTCHGEEAEAPGLVQPFQVMALKGPNNRLCPTPAPAGRSSKRASLEQGRWMRGNGHKLKQGGSVYIQETLFLQEDYQAVEQAD